MCVCVCVCVASPYWFVSGCKVRICVCVCVCVCVCMCVCVHVYTHTRTHMCVLLTPACIKVCACLLVSVYMSGCVCMSCKRLRNQRKNRQNFSVGRSMGGWGGGGFIKPITHTSCAYLLLAYFSTTVNMCYNIGKKFL